MIKSYFTIAWRNLLKNKSASTINIIGLAVGMAVAILIGLWIYDETSYDTYHKNHARVGQIMQQQTSNGEVYTMTALPLPLRSELQNQYGSSFKHLVIASWEGDHILKYGEKKISETGNYISEDAAKLFSLNMIKGSTDGLKDPHSILLSQTTASILFGKEDPMNKLMMIDDKLSVKVTGVYEDIPYNSSLRILKFIAPWDLYVSDQDWVRNASTEWGNNSFQMFAELADNAEFNAVNARIRDSKLNKVAPDEKKYKALILVNPMDDWHLRSNWENGVRTGGLIRYVKLFAYIGVFVLLLACINFMNLSTARSEKRAKEVGIRKAIGSLRGQLIKQFFSESLLVVFFAFLVSMILVQLILPWFNDVANKKMSLPLLSPLFWALALVFTFVTGLIAGSYPALYLSSFQPIKVLKGTFKVGKLAGLPRKILVVIQFTVSITLIIGTIIVYRQINHTKMRPVGYNRNGLISIDMKTPEFYKQKEALGAELIKKGAILSFAASSSPLNGIYSNNSGFNWEGKDPNLDSDFGTIWVEKDFGKTVGWAFTKGRDFSREFLTDSTAIVINEAAVKFMNLKDPIGKVVRWGDDSTAQKLTVIGVVKDMITQSPYKPVKQSIFLMGDNANFLNMRLNSDKTVQESLKIIESEFAKFIQSAPFEYKFADEQYAKKFDDEARIGNLAAFFAVLAVLICCLGLFGLASFVAEQRTKEIGVRKVLGASIFNVWRLLSKEFVLLVFISCLIAIPVAYYYLSEWLQQYEYHTSIAWWIMGAAIVGAFTITLLTVSYQAIRAALANPVKSLRSE